MIIVISMLLISCSNQAENRPSTTEQPTNQTDSASEAEENKNTTDSGYPIVKEPITLKVMGSKDPIHGEWADLAMFKELEALTGIKLEFDTPPVASWEEKKNLAFASGDIPDFFYRGTLKPSDVNTYGSQGILIPLEDLIDQHAPNIKKMFEDYPEVKAAMTSADGHIYTLRQVNVNEKRAQYGNRMWIGPDLLNELNMKMEDLPTNIEDFYVFLKSLQAKGLIPFSSETYSILRGPMLSAFGAIQNADGVAILNDQGVYMPIEPNYKEYLIYMNRLYKEKLLDNDIFSHTKPEFIAKGKNGQLGVFVFQNMQNILDMSLGDIVNKGAPMFAPLTSPINDKPYWMLNSKVYADSTFAITNKNPDPEATIRWIDFIYSAQGTILVQFGKLVDDEFMNDPSKKFSFDEFLTPEQKANQAEYVGKNLTIYNAARYIGDEFAAKTVMESHVAFYEELIEERLVNPYAVEPVPSVSFTNEEQKELILLLNDLTMYKTEMEAKFVAGQESFDRWDQYVSTMEKMGTDKVLDIYQAAYERWKVAVSK